MMEKKDQKRRRLGMIADVRRRSEESSICASQNFFSDVGNERGNRSERKRDSNGLLLNQGQRSHQRVSQEDHRTIQFARGRPKKQQKISFEKLQRLAEMSPDDVVYELTTLEDELQTLINKDDLESDLVISLIRIYANVCKSSLKKNSFAILSMLPESLLLTSNLVTEIQRLPTRKDEHRSVECFIDNMLSLFEKLSEAFPNSCTKLPLDNLDSAFTRIDYIISKDMIIKRIDELMKQRHCVLSAERNPQNNSYGLDVCYGKPPEDFRSLSTLPTKDDIWLSKEPFLRPLNKNGEFVTGGEYLDIQYRLLREDLIAPLRDGIMEIAHDVPRKDREHNIHVFTSVCIKEPHSSHIGIVRTVMFNTRSYKKGYWEHTKKLLRGNLLCFSKDKFKTMFFGTVASREVEMLENGKLYVLFENTLEDQSKLCHSDKYLMVESPSFFQAYHHVLEALKSIENDSVPFSKYIIGGSNTPCCQKYTCELLLVLEEHDFEGCMTETGEQCKMASSELLTWKGKTSLDMSQRCAIHAALTKEFVLIQGPPGTGKTFVGLRIMHFLLQNNIFWNRRDGRGHILLVCYTNHALDQFMENLVQMGHEDIVRVGGGCVNPMLQRFTLAERRQDPYIKPSGIQTAKRKQTKKRERFEQEIEAASHGLEKVREARDEGIVIALNELARFLPDDIKHWFEYLDDQSQQMGIPFLEIYLHLRREPTRLRKAIEDQNAKLREARNWQMGSQDSRHDQVAYQGQATGNNKVINIHHKETTKDRKDTKKRKAMAVKFLSRATKMTESQIMITDPWQLNHFKRWSLYKHLVARYEDHCQRQILEVQQSFEACCNRLNELRLREDEWHLRKRKVIAMTTTGAAKYQQVLGHIKPKIAIIEEAAEVLEAHIVTSLTKETEHVILIGDHKQLKPRTEVYTLAKKYGLEISLFERMVNKGMECHALDVQRRMRPEISCLIADIYPDLKNHDDVSAYPDVKGVSSNVFFVNHSFPEEGNAESKSKSNKHEAEYITALCKYLILQGYSQKQITVLTLYTGQLLLLRRRMPREGLFCGVKIQTVDNYQGEENDIVLISLVRSNRIDKIGFSGDENRICVTLSRAKHGMFLVGNFTLLARRSAMWKKITARAKDKHQFGDSLRLHCQNHPKTCTDAKVASDFRKAPEGGCCLPCSFRLECGHNCALACHPFDRRHRKMECKKKCNKTLPCAIHKCPERCHHGRDCPPCKEPSSKRIHSCGHIQTAPCAMDPSDIICHAKVTRELLCGHQLELDCSKSPEVDAICKAKCSVKLECGHNCSGNCSECHQGRLHMKCTHPCNRVLVCSHVCKEPCSKACPPCQEECLNQCMHNQCPLKCGAICMPCIMPCNLGCRHQKCQQKSCHEQCNIKPCNRPCPRFTTCQSCKDFDKCIGLCGEPCPTWCKKCDQQNIREIFFGFEDEEDARFVQLVDCNHIFEVKGLDKWMKGETKDDTIKVKVCPKCKTPIRRSLRYGNIIKTIDDDINAVKKKVLAGNDNEKHLKALQRKLDDILKLITSRFCYNKDLTLIQKSIEQKMSEIKETGLERVNANQVDLVTRIEIIVSLVQQSGRTSVEYRSLSAENRRILPHLRNVTEICIQRNITTQQIMDCDLELQRITLMSNAYESDIWEDESEADESEVDESNDTEDESNISDTGVHESKINESMTYKSGARTELKKIISLLESGKKLSQEEIENFKEQVNAIRRWSGQDALYESERKMVITAMNLKAGHWFKCPNGHYYAIGECGGAMQHSRCPECKVSIGGASHRLAEGNAHAGEFDGSCHAAWSHEANVVAGRFH